MVVLETFVLQLVSIAYLKHTRSLTPTAPAAATVFENKALIENRVLLVVGAGPRFLSQTLRLVQGRPRLGPRPRPRARRYDLFSFIALFLVDYNDQLVSSGIDCNGLRGAIAVLFLRNNTMLADTGGAPSNKKAPGDLCRKLIHRVESSVALGRCGGRSAEIVAQWRYWLPAYHLAKRRTAILSWPRRVGWDVFGLVHLLAGEFELGAPYWPGGGFHFKVMGDVLELVHTLPTLPDSRRVLATLMQLNR
ncbi:hypothetical protein CHU98_g5514 [Xylaria longipes]|nr:hypothetical protein CHU98_g5514 [Xylaria longipes]